MLPPSLLATLFAPMTTERFLELHWPFTHCAHHADPSRLKSLFELPELRTIDTLLASAKRDVKVAFTSEENRYYEVSVDSQQARSLYRAGLSICLSGVDRWVPGLRAWVDGLINELGALSPLSKCNAYASRAGSGFAKHWDAHEVIIVQLSGTKRWLIGPNHQISYPVHNYVPAAGGTGEIRTYLPYDLTEEMPPDSTEVVMRPGSVLFLPRGTWHMTEAQEGDSLSLTFSLHLPTWLDLVLGHLRIAMLRAPHWRQPADAFSGNESRRAVAQTRLAWLLDQLGEEIKSFTAEEVLRQYARGPSSATQLLDARVWRKRETATAFRIHFCGGGLAEVLVQPAEGEAVSIEVDASMVPVFAWIEKQSEPFSGLDLRNVTPELTAETYTQIVAALEDFGLLEPVSGR